MKETYHVFVRGWLHLAFVDTEAEAQQMCAKWNATHHVKQQAEYEQVVVMEARMNGREVDLVVATEPEGRIG